MRSVERKKNFGEVFTPAPLVEEMLDKLPEEAWEDGKTFCDPAAGNGNFLVAVLQRKINKGHTKLNTVYGVDIMEDNIKECIERLNKLYTYDWSKNIKRADSLKFDWENGFEI